MNAAPRPTAKRSPSRALLVRTTALLAGILLPLGLLELGVRVFYPTPLHPTDTYLVPQGWQSGTMELVPGADVREKTVEWDIRIRINSQGLRDREIPLEKAPGVYRILVLGDSQTFGQGVQAEETYAKVLERALPEVDGRKVEVVNTGVPGTGTAHQLWYLEQKGWRYQPDAVVVGFYFNDIVDNSQCYLFGLENGKLVHTAAAAEQATHAHELAPTFIDKNDYRAMRAPKAPPPPKPSWLVENSHLARLMRLALSRIQQSRAQPTRASRPAKEMTTRLFGEVARQCRERGVPCVVALIPSKEQKAEGKVKSLADTWAPYLTEARARGARVVDLWPAFERDGFPRLFLRTDPHLNAAGHRLIGETLAAEFRSKAKGRIPKEELEK